MRIVLYRGFVRNRTVSGYLLSLISGLLVACTPPDQRLFNPQAGMSPKPYSLSVPPAKPAPAAFLQIVAGTPKEDWLPVVQRSTKLALSRKPSVLFIVSVLSSDTSSPAAQASALERLTAREGREVAEQIVASGALISQVQIEAKTDPSSPKERIRVDLR